MSAKFSPNEIVQRVNQPEVNGVILDQCWDDQTESWTYRVQFNGVVTAVPETSLRGWTRLKTPWEKLRAQEFSGIEHFRDTITFHKVKSPTARVAHAYSSARTIFYPHQFKPLLKFLDGGGDGLLIADDVGLGKTIEAGYILRELDARKNLERVMVLAPARLATKWKREMAQRFEEPFEIVKGADLINLSNSLERGREISPFKWIVSYEGSRNQDVQEALDAAQPSLDLLIVDEAHRLRNPETLQHRLGRLLCNLADHRIFLTATPVQNSLDDLWNLLKLLSEEEFPDFEIFRRQMAANRRVLECQRHLSSHPPCVDDAINMLLAIGPSDGFGAPVSETFLASIVSRMQKEEFDSEGLAELQIDISQLNTLGHVVTRTRKSDAMPNCAQRVAHWQPIDFTDPERRIYESVESLCKVRPSQDSSLSWGFQMATLMAYRATASCIPAAIEYYEERLEALSRNALGAFSDFDSDDPNDDANGHDTVNDIGSWFRSQKEILSQLVNDWTDNDQTDTKFEEFLDALKMIWSEDEVAKRPRRKIVVFSFFRKTLEYLRKSLGLENIEIRMIHGKIGLEERDRAIEDFLERPDVELLLTSEVGGEGIDLQKASVVFNYDLPWNPMVVEQRIGRVDRIGQEAERIVIINFVVQGSIEERILARLLNKIGIFEASVGEIDPIIGDQIEKLTREAVSGTLTSEELERKLVKEEQAIANRTVAAKQVEGKAEDLLTTDQSLLDEIAALTGERQVPGEADLLRFLNNFLAAFYPGHLIPEKSLSGVQRFKLSPQLAREIEEASSDLGTDVAFFGRKIASGDLLATLSREVAYRHTNADLIHFNHPLVKFAVWKWAGRFGNETFCLSLRESEVLDPGLYAFAARIIELDGPIPRNKLHMAIVDCQKDDEWSDQNVTVPVLLEILEGARSDSPAEIQIQVHHQVEVRLNTILDRYKNELDRREKQLTFDRLNQRKAISVRLTEMKLRRAKDQVSKMIDSGAKDFAIKMGNLKIKKAEETLRTARNLDIEHASAGVGGWTDIAVGYLKVGIKE
jgi:superfamily II DNA or RNA helicase